MAEFQERFNIIYEKYLSLANSGQGAGASKLGLARYLGISQGRMQHWESGRTPNAADCLVIAEKLGFNLRWVITGEGEMFSPDPALPQVGTGRLSVLARPIPMLGLASCGIEGIEQVMPNTVVSSPLTLGPRSFGVSAYGSSLLPLGISNLHVCYCDPDLEAVHGEIACVRTKDGRGTLKLFLGEGAREGYLAFRGWQEPDKTGHQEAFTLQLLQTTIDCIAPVVLIRRRM